ncbi:hypothetical protein GBF38_022040 [Nibea albiflora]|uniref:Uncharacterized protein n=1 Tax=Nibea albiflora TaxID=240163 RepID=A0ACB7FGD4_NIBAL|nr:hypothetical protein GBF38_022040 [Nibea albiflora]
MQTAMDHDQTASMRGGYEQLKQQGSVVLSKSHDLNVQLRHFALLTSSPSALCRLTQAAGLASIKKRTAAYSPRSRVEARFWDASGPDHGGAMKQ